MGRNLHIAATAAIAIVVLIAFGSCLVFGQSTAAISGVVRDSSGAVVPGVTVTVRHIESGLARTAVTNESGSYVIQLLPVGAYEITTDLPGFKQAVRRGVNLVVGQEAVVNMTLEVGAAAELVTVTGEAPIVNTTLASTSGLVNEAQIKDLPLNGRSFDQLLTVTTGTVNYSPNTTQLGSFFSVAGRRPEENTFTINGVEFIGSQAAGQPAGPSGSSGMTLGVDAVREFNLVQHTYGAEYGKRAGGHVSVVTTSGTNQWHGSVFEYVRNSVFDAARWEDNAFNGGLRPNFQRNQFGGSMGGPLKKDKVFIFANYEGFRQRLGKSSVAVVPDAQARQGFLPCYIATPTACGSNPGQYVAVPNLKTGMLPYASNFWPTPGNELFVGAGLPNAGLATGTAFATGNPKQSIREDFGLTRFDYNPSTKDSFYINYLISDGDRTEPQANAVFSQISRSRPQVLSFQETHVFSPTLLNSFNSGYTRAFAPVSIAPNTQIPSNLAFVTGRLPGQITIGGGSSATAASSIVAANGNDPTGNALNLFTTSDDVRWTRGKHSFSLGAWMQRVQENQSGPAQNKSGTVAYSSLLTFLQDSPTSFNANLRVTPLGYRQWESAIYFQDEVKLRSNFTLRLGLRDEMTNGWHEVKSRCSNLLFDAAGVPTNDFLIGDSCLTVNNAKALLQPRVGIAWDPTGTGSWAVRAGFGIHNDLQDNLAFRLDSNPPYNPRIVLSGPVLNLVPLDPANPMPPTCNAQLVAAKANCAIYTVGGVEPTMHTPTVQQWSFSLERGITQNLALQVSYVGSEAYHTLLPINMNAPHSQVCTNAAGCQSGGVGRPVVTVPQETTYIAPTGTCAGPNGTSISCYPNPYQNLTNSQMFEGTMSYNSLNVSLVKRASRGLSFKANYTFSKSIDYNSAGSSSAGTNQPKAILDPYNLSLSRGLAAFNLKHQFNANYAYQLPFGQGQRFGGNAGGVLNRIIGGWQWNGIITAQSGFPFTPQAGSNISGTGDTNNPDVPNFNPAFSGPIVLGVDGFKKTGRYFESGAFLLPMSGTFGNVARGALTGPPLTTVDTSLFKKISINEQLNLQFRAEAFNVLNHANFAIPNAVVFQGTNYSSSAGVITATATTSRQIQFALKLLW
jgi:Carboxypeptidase regulatory-like domain